MVKIGFLLRISGSESCAPPVSKVLPKPSSEKDICKVVSTVLKILLIAQKSNEVIF